MNKKHISICLIGIIILLTNVPKSIGATYNIDKYYGNGSNSPTALLNRGSAYAFATGDTLNFADDLTAAHSNIGSLGVFTLNITGNDKTIDGTNYTGFSVLSGATYKFDTINLDNFTGTNGAAINNAGTSTVTNSSFENNSASNLGGAIYNARTLYIVGNRGNTVFSGNNSTTNHNAIYNTGTLYLNAGNGGYILFDDKITSDIASRNIYINNPAISVANSNVIFNNTVSNSTATMYSGMMTLGKSDNILSGVRLNLNGGTLNTANGNININTLASLTSSASTKLFFDADLYSGKNDRFNVTGTAGGTLTIGGVNIMTDAASTVLELFASAKSPALTSITAYTNGYKYDFSPNPTAGVLNISRMASSANGGLYDSILDTSANRSFSATGDVTLTTNLGTMVGSGTTLTLFGNTHDLNGALHSGVTMASGRTLNIYNFDSNAGINGFKSINGGAIYNTQGTVNISDSYFKGNIATGSLSGVGGGAIYSTSAATTTITNSSFDSNIAQGGSGGAIYASGATTINGGSFTYNQTQSGSGKGGAIFNNSSALNLINQVNFSHNSSINGGAIYNAGTATIDGGTYTSNTANASGGAIYNSAGTSTITGATFNSNKASNTFGGAIYNSSPGTLTVDSCHFTGNNAQGSDNGGGGAIDNTAASVTQITNSDFNSNYAINGGAIFVNGKTGISNSSFTGNGIDSSGPTITAKGGAIFNNTDSSAIFDRILTLTGTSFYNNIAVNGGAIYISPNTSTTTTINNGTYSNNAATNFGGAIYNGTGTTNITGATFTDNGSLTIGGTTYKTISGGAIYNGSGYALTLTDSTFSNNSATTSGGAIYNDGTINISGSSFDDNAAASSGGAIYNNGTISSLGGTFTDNYASRGGAVCNAGTITEISNGTKFTNNTTPYGYGGAIYNSGEITSLGGTFKDNSANGGGAIYNIGKITEVISGTTFQNNSAINKGGAIYNTNGGTIKLGDADFTSNSTTGAYGEGGAVFNQSNSTITNSSGDYTDNLSIYGGAIFNCGTFTLKNASFTTNTASLLSGAIYNVGTIGITGTTFDTNSAQYGGAIENQASATTGTAVAKVTLSDDNIFKNNYATCTKSGTDDAIAYGGAIYNNAAATTGSATATVDISHSSFTNNSASANSSGGTASAMGGAIANTYSITTGTATATITLDNATFEKNSVTAAAKGTSDTTAAKALGGAVYNTGIANITNSTFKNSSASATSTSGSNYAYGYGGAVYNKGIATFTNTDFTNNSAKTNGGAIYNAGTLHVQADGGTSTFTGNNVNGSSNAIYNTGTVYLDTDAGSSITFNDAITSDINSRTTNINSGSSLNSGTVNFNNNISKSTLNIAGGTTNVGKSSVANVNVDDVAVNITGGTQNFTNTTLKNGSRVYLNDTSSSSSNSTNFINSTFNGYSYAGSGAAIYNASGTVNISPTNFSGYTATGDGGAIYNAGTTVFNGGTYDNNTATNGGAVYNSGTATFTNTTFTGNKATGDGGAIYNLGKLYLKADGGQTILTGNEAGGIHNGLYNHGTVYLNAGNGGSITFNDTVNSSDITTSTININSPAGSPTLTDGIINFNNNVTNSTINLYGGQIKLGIDSALTGGSLNIFGCALSMINQAVGYSALQTLTLADGTVTYLGIDVDLARQISDRIIVTTAAYGDGTINVNDINLISNSSLSNMSIPFADSAFRDRVTVGVKTVTTPIYLYAVGYNSSSGDLTFNATSVSPNAVTSDIAQTQAFLLQTAIDRQFFANMESFMSFPLATRESTICCALSNGQATGAACPISGNGTFSPIYSCDLNRGIWVKTFTSFENIPLRNGPNVSTVEYGTLIGADAPLTYLKRGWVGNTSAYVGYLGSNQNYDGVGVSQNGALVGLAENMVKGNNFVTLMASVGSSMGIANTQWGNDYFNSLFAGVAVKGGHNFELKKGDYIIQPSLMLAYTYTYTPSYNTASGIEMTSKPLNAMQVAPGIRLIKNLRQDKGQVYLVGNFVYNIMDNTKFSANDVQLPELSIAPYFEYGIGYQRVWKERFTGFFQTLLRGGGRNGVALQFGMRWAI
ncbi:MAG: hypothetical protein WCY19_07210 [Candidatus Gastranaerophilaceae bacterium]